MSGMPRQTPSEPAHHFYCGIDLHKRQARLHVVNTKAEVVRRVTVQADTGAVFAVLEEYRPLILAGVEATTGADDLADGLTEAGISCLVGHPGKMNRTLSLHGKSDRRDAAKIAALLVLDEFPHTNRVRKVVRKLRSLLRQRASLVSARQGVRARATLRTPCEHNSSAGVANILKTTPYCLLSLDAVAAACDADADSGLTAPIDHLERASVRVAEQVFGEVFHRVVAIPGVGAITAASLLAEVGDIGHFRQADNLLGYAGLVPRRRQSGDKTVANYSLACNDHLKSAFLGAARSVLIHCPAARIWASRSQTGNPQKGKECSRQAGEDRASECWQTGNPQKGSEWSVARKLAEAIYHLWRDAVAYDPARAFPACDSGRVM